jgi:hypothetical protein
VNVGMAQQGRLKHGNAPGDPTTAPRCGARTRQGTSCQSPAMRGKGRCRLHGGLSTGPRTLEGLRRLRAARTKHGRFSAEGLAFERWRRQYIAGGFQSARAMEDPRAREHFLRRAAEDIRPSLLEEMQRTTSEEVARQDVERLQAKKRLSGR